MGQESSRGPKKVAQGVQKVPKGSQKVAKSHEKAIHKAPTRRPKAMRKQQSNQATKQRRNEATKQQSNKATKQPSNQATKQRSNKATKQPRQPRHPRAPQTKRLKQNPKCYIAKDLPNQKDPCKDDLVSTAVYTGTQDPGRGNPLLTKTHYLKQLIIKKTL